VEYAPSLPATELVAKANPLSLTRQLAEPAMTSTRKNHVDFFISEPV
jgi:hypothetical protein